MRKNCYILTSIKYLTFVVNSYKKLIFEGRKMDRMREGKVVGGRRRLSIISSLSLTVP